MSDRRVNGRYGAVGYGVECLVLCSCEQGMREQ